MMGKRALAAACAAMMMLTLGGCGAKRPETFTSQRRTSFDHFGTMCTILVYDDFASEKAMARVDAAWAEIGRLLTEVENTLSVDIAESDISRFNALRSGESVGISPLTAVVVQKAMDAYTLTGGAYNPAVSNLVDLWGFSPRFFNQKPYEPMPYDRERRAEGGYDLPQKRYVEAFRALCDFSAVELSGDAETGYTLIKRAEDVEVDGVVYSLKIDLGGIGKGYAADMAADILERYGYEYGFVNFGLSSLRLLKRHVKSEGATVEHDWGIQVVDPDSRDRTLVTAFGQGVGVATSGTYEISYVVDGREYSHIIDPWTGEPTQRDIVSVTLVGALAAECDALSTAICIMGRDEAVEFTRMHLSEYRYILLVREGDGFDIVTNMEEGSYIVR